MGKAIGRGDDMDVPCLLKEEINQALRDLHDFAKWKLIVVSALAAATLGLPGSSIQGVSFWLLLFVPFACAYIDLNCYQYMLRIFLISKVLRDREGDDDLLDTYERQCESYRKKGLFGLGLFAQVGCSMVFSLILPPIAIVRLLDQDVGGWKIVMILTSWFVGIAVVVICYLDFDKRRRMLGDTGSEDSA